MKDKHTFYILLTSLVLGVVLFIWSTIIIINYPGYMDIYKRAFREAQVPFFLGLAVTFIPYFIFKRIEKKRK